MECNKAEAVRAKEIAENMLKKGDFTGAKKLALKAQALFPELEGLSKILDVVNVYAAENHYGVLGVDPSADEELMRKHYNRLLLSIHPDKNSIDGAGGAFILVRHAWKVLSDKDQRRTYDTELNPIKAPNQSNSLSSMTPPFNSRQQFSSFQRPVNMSSFQRRQWTPPATVNMPSFQHCQWTPPATVNMPSRRTPETASAAQSVPASRPIFRYVRCLKQASLDTFWTGCSRCHIKYEYEKLLKNRLLQCPTCLNPFLSVAVPAPPSRRQRKDPVVASGGPTNLRPSVARAPQPQAGQDKPSVYHAESGQENVDTLNLLNKWKSAKSDTPHSKRVDRKDSLDSFNQDGLSKPLLKYSRRNKEKKIGERKS